MKNFIQKFTRLDAIALVAMAVAWSWIFQVDVARLANSNAISSGVVFVIYIILVAVSWLVARTVWRYFKLDPTEYSAIRIIKLVLIWAAAEMLIAWVINLVVMGREGTWSNTLPFASLTPIVMMTPLKFLARFLGFFGTSAVVGSGLLILYRKQWKVGAVYWAVLVAVATVSWAVYRSPSGNEFTATVVSENVGEQIPIDTSRSDFILVPEYGLDEYEPQQDDRFLSNDREVSFSGTKRSRNNRGGTNVLVYGTTKQGITEEYIKSRLVAFGEYLPLGSELYLRAAHRDVYDDFMHRRGIVRSEPRYEVYKVSDGVIAGNAPCSSIANPNDYRKLTGNGATFLANSASLEIFKGSLVYSMFHHGLARFMAVANARPFLQSANEWQAFALDHNANVLKSVEPVNTTEVAITTNTRTTPYTILGEWVAILGFITMGAIIFRKVVRSKSIRQSAVKTREDQKLQKKALNYIGCSCLPSCTNVR